MSGFSLNYALVVGKIVEIPKVLYNQQGEPTAHIHLCVKKITESDLPYAGNPWEDMEIADEWVLVVCHDDLAEWAERNLDGGDLITCEGNLGAIKWLDGKRDFHREYGITARKVELVEKKAFEVEKPKRGVKPNIKKR